MNDLDNILYKEEGQNEIESVIEKYSLKIDEKLNKYLTKIDKSKTSSIEKLKETVNRFKESIKGNDFDEDYEEDIADLYDDCLDKLDEIYEESQEDISNEISLEIEKYLVKIEEKRKKYLYKSDGNMKAQEEINEEVEKFKTRLKNGNFDEDYEEDIADLYDDCLDELDEIYSKYKDESNESKKGKKNDHIFSFNFKDWNFSKKTNLDENLDFGETKKIITLLPFMSKSDIDDCIDKILNNDESMKNINTCVFLPFASLEKINDIFDAAISGNERIKLSTVIPFVSQEKLSEFVDEYVEGKHQNVNVNILYPFLKSSDVKRIFSYIIEKDKKNE